MASKNRSSFATAFFVAAGVSAAAALVDTFVLGQPANAPFDEGVWAAVTFSLVFGGIEAFR